MQPILYEILLIQCEICKIYEGYPKDYPEKKRRDEDKREKEKRKKKSQEKQKEQELKSVQFFFFLNKRIQLKRKQNEPHQKNSQLQKKCNKRNYSQQMETPMWCCQF